jgi:hypothetical protein
VLLSRSTAGIVDDAEIDGVAVRDPGEHRLKDLDGPERVFRLVIEGLPVDFPPLRHSGEAGVGWAGAAAIRCVALCDAAEAGQIFLSQAVSGLLEEEDLGGASSAISTSSGLGEAGRSSTPTSSSLPRRRSASSCGPAGFHAAGRQPPGEPPLVGRARGQPRGPALGRQPRLGLGLDRPRLELDHMRVGHCFRAPRSLAGEVYQIAF